MAPIYNKFSDNYDSLYLSNLLEFQKKAIQFNSDDNRYVDFYPSFGIKSGQQCEFLIYGQAVKDKEGPGFNLSNIIQMEYVKERIYYSNSFYEKEDHSPLDWVNVLWNNNNISKIITDSEAALFYGLPKNAYRTHRSFFWNLIYKLICDYYSDTRDSWNWSKKIVWSNLYKIAPRGGNPNENEKNWQKDKSIELIKREIFELKPKFIIVITNESWWEPFRTILNSKKTDKAFLNVESVEFYNDSHIIVTKRPFRGNTELFVNEILKIIKNKDAV